MNATTAKTRAMRRSMRPGFTLIEVAVATALAGMMMVVLMGLLGRMYQQVEDLEPHRSWLQAFKQQLEFDFANCRSILVNPQQIKIDGYSSTDLVEGTHRRLPTIVTYQIIEQGFGKSWLVRSEEKLFGNINDSLMIHPVCTGVRQFIDRSDMNVDFPPNLWNLALVLENHETGESETIEWWLHRHGANQ